MLAIKPVLYAYSQKTCRYVIIFETSVLLSNMTKTDGLKNSSGRENIPKTEMAMKEWEWKLTTLRVRRVRKQNEWKYHRISLLTRNKQNLEIYLYSLTNLPLQTLHLFLNPTIFMKKQHSPGIQLLQSLKSCLDLV